MDKFTGFLQRTLVPFGNWLQRRKTLNALTAGMRISFPLIIFGCFLNLFANPPIAAAWLEGNGIIANILNAWNNFTITYKDLLMTPYNLTMGIMGFIIVISMAYYLAKDYKLDPLMTSVIAMVVFLMVSAPPMSAVSARAIAGAESLDGLAAQASSMMPTGFLGSSGMFTGIFVALISVQITRFCRDKHIEIKLPDSIPPVVALSFSAILPLLFNILIIYGANVILLQTLGLSVSQLIMAFVVPAVNAVSNPFVMLGILVLGQLFWCIGIHGGILLAPIMPIYIAACLNNAELIQQGMAPVFQPVMLMTATSAGGAGCMLALAILLWRSKSKQLKAIGKIGVIPAFFGISEPLIFGVPIILNPLLCIPMILAPVAIFILSCIGYYTGILAPLSVPILATLPLGVGPLLASNSIVNFFFPYICVALGMLVYFPFVKVYEKQKLAEEAQIEAENPQKEGSKA